MIDFYNPKNWKTTHQKEFNGYICLPPIDTRFFNKNLGVNQITTSKEQFVLSYPNGMLQTLSLNGVLGLKKAGEVLTKEILAEKYLINGRMNWQSITFPSNDVQLLAIRLPINKKEYIDFAVGDFIANKTGIEHGDGDYIVCPKLPNGTPDLRYALVVNGLLFPYIYSLASIRLSLRMKRYIERSKTVIPQPLFKETSKDLLVEKLAAQFIKHGVKVSNTHEFHASSQYDLNPPDESWFTVYAKSQNLVLELVREGKEYTMYITVNREKNPIKKKKVQTVKYEQLGNLVSATALLLKQHKII